MTYAVGQVLYVLSRNKNTIVPIQIVEELTTKTLNDQEITYRVRVGESNDVASIKQIDGEIFESPQLLVDTLTKRAITNIQAVVDDAVNLANAWYPNRVQQHVVKHEQQNDEDSQVITLPDGSIARVKLPPELL